MTIEGILAALMLGVVGACSYTDLRHGKIPNVVTLPAIVVGLALNAGFHGWQGLGQAVAGVGVALALWIVTGALGGCLGGGDIKLLAAIGALSGAKFLVAALVVTVVAGGVMALALSLWKGQLRVALRNILSWTLTHMGLQPAMESGPGTCGLTLPYALPIAAGVVVCLLHGYWRVV